MATLVSSVNPIVVATGPVINPVTGGTTPGVSGTTSIKYEKLQTEELWENLNGAGWVPVNAFARVGTADADSFGTWAQSLSAGRIYELGTFSAGRGPRTVRPNFLAYLRVGCIVRGGRRSLILSRRFDRGGTWCSDVVRTSFPTHIIGIGADHTPPFFDADGIPQFEDTAGRLATPLPSTRRQTHSVEVNPLLPGQPHVYAVVVVNSRGEWDVATELFTTLRRKLTVSFPTVHIYNDGDANTGEARFWFRVATGTLGGGFGGRVLQDFHCPEFDVDDWSRTGRPYPMGFAHLGPPTSVVRGEERIYVQSWALEDEGPFDTDDGANSIVSKPLRGQLPLPTGRLVESAGGHVLLDCPPSTVGGEFHYGVDVNWDVQYVP